jgi:hypothetical protein
MLRRDLASPVLKLPRWIRENGAELLPPRRSEQVDCGFGEEVGGGERKEIVMLDLRSGQFG